jgi:CheY-like chemotaxis protein
MPRVTISKRIKDAFSELGKEAGDIVGNTLRVTRDITMGALGGTTRSKKSDATRQVAKEAIEGAINAGSEAGADLGSVAKEAMIGTVEGVSEVSKINGGVVGDAARAAVGRTGKLGGDVIAVARKVVEGAIEAGDRVGFGAEDAASAAIAGAIEAAEGISKTTATAVAKALSVTFAGARMAFGLPPKKPIILSVDSNQTNLELLSQQLLKEDYETLTASSLEELDEVIGRKENIKLSLIDLSGFDQRIWERCSELHKAKIPYIVIAPQRSPAIQRDSMKYGASSLLVKPVGTKELMEYIHTLLGD